MVFLFRQLHDFTREGEFNVTAIVSDGRPGHDVQAYVLVNVTVLDHIPLASFSVDPASGDTGTIFTFDASGSSDVETPSDQLQVRWDFDNDGTWDTGWSTTKTLTHQFGSAGTYTVALEVQDAGGMTNVTTCQVEVAEPIPELPMVATTTILLIAILAFLRSRGDRTRG